MIDIDNDPDNLSDYVFLFVMTLFLFHVSIWFGIVCVIAAWIAITRTSSAKAARKKTREKAARTSDTE